MTESVSRRQLESLDGRISQAAYRSAYVVAGIFVLAGVGLSQLVTMMARRFERLGLDASRIATLSACAG